MIEPRIVTEEIKYDLNELKSIENSISEGYNKLIELNIIDPKKSVRLFYDLDMLRDKIWELEKGKNKQSYIKGWIEIKNKRYK